MTVAEKMLLAGLDVELSLKGETLKLQPGNTSMTGRVIAIYPATDEKTPSREVQQKARLIFRAADVPSNVGINSIFFNADDSLSYRIVKLEKRTAWKHVYLCEKAEVEA